MTACVGWRRRWKTISAGSRRTAGSPPARATGRRAGGRSRLMSGPDIAAAKRLIETRKPTAPEMLAVQIDFIQSSERPKRRRSERERELEERRGLAEEALAANSAGHAAHANSDGLGARCFRVGGIRDPKLRERALLKTNEDLANKAAAAAKQAAEPPPGRPSILRATRMASEVCNEYVPKQSRSRLTWQPSAL